jgi:hypothetical protein
LGLVEPWSGLPAAIGADASVEPLVGWSLVALVVLVLGVLAVLGVAVVLASLALAIELSGAGAESTGVGVSAGEGVVEEVGVEVELRLELLVAATLFDELFTAFLVLVSCEREELTALWRGASSTTGAASATLAAGLSTTAFVLAATAGGVAFDSVRLEAGGRGRKAVPEVPML